MKVLFFAQSRVAAQCDSTTLNIARPISVAEFWRVLVEQISALAPLAKTARLARREAYLDAGDTIQPSDEIAVIPPVSGG